jgi:hypothetical protein
VTAWFPEMFCSIFNERSQMRGIIGSFCHQEAAWFSDMFCNFYLAKNCETAKNSTTTKAREKISTYLDALEFYKCF